jgi:hypothetical protein
VGAAGGSFAPAYTGAAVPSQLRSGRQEFDPLRFRRDTARVARYDDSLSLREARRQYFDANGFAEGGYDAKWVKVKIGPLPFAFPNTPQRVRSVRLHDLHHVVTDYDTSMTGEAEIGAWEIASNCRNHWAAWLLNLFALAMGLFLSPPLMWHAFVRGRHSRNLYEREFDEAMLGGTVRDLRSQLKLGDRTPAGDWRDAAAFVFWSAAGLLTFGLGIAAMLLPVLLALRWFAAA